MVTEIIFKKRRKNFPIVTRKRCKNLAKTEKCAKNKKSTKTCLNLRNLCLRKGIQSGYGMLG